MNQAELAKKAKRLEQEKHELMAALRPFAGLKRPYHDKMQDSEPLVRLDDATITVKDLVKAHNVYNKNS